MEHRIRNTLVIVFAAAILVFTTLALLSIWEFVDDEVIWKSLSTLVVLVASAALIFGIIKLAEQGSPKQRYPVKVEETE